MVCSANVYECLLRLLLPRALGIRQSPCPQAAYRLERETEMQCAVILSGVKISGSQTHLEGLLKHRLMGPTPRISDPGDLG